MAVASLLCTILLCSSLSLVVTTDEDKNSITWPEPWKELVASGACATAQLQAGLCYGPEPPKNGSRHCSCEPYCAKYGDCCIDMGIEHYANFSDWKCVPLGLNKPRVYALGSCPADWKDPDVRESCDVIKPTLDPGSFFAVYGARKKQYYMNIYCARCHDDLESELKYQVSCPTDSDDIENLFMDGSFYYRDGDEVKRCKVESIGRYFSEGTSLVPCTESKSECAHLWPDDDIKKLCLSYKFEVSNDWGFVYKNYHCYYCNLGFASKLSCLREAERKWPDPHAKVRGQKFTLTMMIEDDVESEKRSLKGYCTLNQQYDYALKKCITVVCPDGYRWFVSRCVKGVRGPDTQEEAWNDFIQEQFFTHQSRHSLKCRSVNEFSVLRSQSRSDNGGNKTLLKPQETLGVCKRYGSFTKGVKVSLKCSQNGNSSVEHSSNNESWHSKTIQIDFNCEDSFCNSVFVVNKCPADWTDEDVKQSCESSDPYGSGLGDALVHSKRDNFLYQNIYCAHCHNDSAEFRIQVKCPTSVPVSEGEHHDDRFIVSYSNVTRGFIVNENGTEAECNVTRPPDDIPRIPENPNVRFCPSASSKCLNSTIVNVLRTSCQTYSKNFEMSISTVDIRGTDEESWQYNCTGTINNKGQFGKGLLCKIFTRGGSSDSYTMKKSIAIDLHIKPQGQPESDHRDVGETCGYDEFFEPVLKMCLRVTCPEGLIWKKTKCVKNT